MPAPEVLLWQKLRAGQIHGLKFRRQYSIGRYIVDFFCPEERLAIEIDGDSHYEPNAVEYDRERDKFIESKNIKLIRLSNKEIIENIEGAVSNIVEATDTPLNFFPDQVGDRL